MMERLDVGLAELNQAFRGGKTRGVEWRKSQLRAIIKLVTENEAQIFEALHQDLGKHPVEAYRDEIGIVKKSADHSLLHIEKWMALKKGWLPLLLFPATGQVLPEPFGTVLIIGSWNFPISLALDPVIGAISAGNTVVLKPSEIAPACSSFLHRTVPLYLDKEAIKVIPGGREIAEQLLQHRWDKIFFTGSPRVARTILSAAAKHLTPVTLELGGKCPVILDSFSGSDLQVAVKRIVGGKWGPCAGQACIGVDYVLVQQKDAPVLVELLKNCIKKFYGDKVDKLQNICRIVNQHHFDRVRNLLEDPSVLASIVYGGSVDCENLMIEPTILVDPPLDSEIMMEEIFGPLLPIITVQNRIHRVISMFYDLYCHRNVLRHGLILQLDKIEESIDFIKERPKPLAIYAFTRCERFKQRIMQETSSGSLTFNDIMIQFLCDALPFGGVGESGFGRYHGKYSFDTFSHEKAILQRSFLLELEPRYPPWNDFKLDFIKMAYNFNYIGLVLLLLRRMLRRMIN